MTDAIENARFVQEIRMKVMENQRENRPSRHGISAEDEAKFIEILRGGRQRQAPATKAKKSTKRTAPISDAELENLFGKLPE